MNKVLLIGRMTREAELRTTQSGKTVATLTIAVDDGYGENKKTYFHNVVVWGKGAEAVCSYTHKGSKIGVTGKLTSRTYEKDGQKRYITEVVADMMNGVEFLESKGTSNGNSNGGGGTVYSDDEIPF